MLFKGSLPVSAGKKFFLMISSSSLMRWQMFGVVRVRKDHLLHQSWVYAVNAASPLPQLEELVFPYSNFLLYNFLNIRLGANGGTKV